MPEGHTIHRLARDLRRDLGRQQLQVHSPQGRFTEESQLLSGDMLQTTDAWGKHLFLRWKSGWVVHIHLGLYGKFRRHKTPPPEPRPTVRLRLLGRDRCWDLVGPNRCELLSEEGEAKLLQRLGPDPLRADADVDQVWQRIRKSRVSIGGLLLNQAVIAGVGNVYRAEVLFDQRIAPETRGCDLSQEQFLGIWERLCEWLQIGVRYNRIITAEPEQVGRSRGRMRRKERLQCYGHAACTECGTEIECWELANRKMYACPVCQAGGKPVGT